MLTSRTAYAVLVALAAVLAASTTGGEPRGYSAEELQPRRAGRAVFRLTKGKKTRPIHAEFRPEGKAEEDATRWIFARPSLITDVMELRDGQWVMPEARVEYEDSRVVFHPPAILLPADLRPGVPTQQSGTVEVYGLEKGKHIVSGKFERVIEMRGRRRLRLPEGPLEVIVVRITESFEFAHAEAKVVTVRAYAPGRGVVHEAAREKVTKIGVITTESALTLELQETWRPMTALARP